MSQQTVHQTIRYNALSRHVHKVYAISQHHVFMDLTFVNSIVKLIRLVFTNHISNGINKKTGGIHNDSIAKTWLLVPHQHARIVEKRKQMRNFRVINARRSSNSLSFIQGKVGLLEADKMATVLRSYEGFFELKSTVFNKTFIIIYYTSCCHRASCPILIKNQSIVNVFRLMFRSFPFFFNLLVIKNVIEVVVGIC